MEEKSKIEQKALECPVCKSNKAMIVGTIVAIICPKVMTFCLDILSAKVPPIKLKLSIDKVPAPPTKPTFNAEAVNSHTKKPRATVCICMALIIKIKPTHNLRKFGFNSDSSILPNETLRFSLIVLQPYFKSKVIGILISI